jgi:hypothetical protein
VEHGHLPHDANLAKLTGLRDQLKVGRSSTAHEPVAAAALNVAELASGINALKDAKTIEAATAIEDGLPAQQVETPMITLPFTAEGRIERQRLSAASVQDDPSPGFIPIRTSAVANFAFQSIEHTLVRLGDVAQGRAPPATTQQRGRSIMARSKSKPAEANQSAGETQEVSNETTAPAVEVSGPAQQAVTLKADATTREEPAPEARKPIVTPDPRPVMSISLGDTKGSPRVQLRRSHQFKQMQIQFDRQPDEKYLAMLAEAGWKDRTECEGIWTKQVGQGQWQPVADAEREFKAVANAIRTDKGLKPVMKEQSVA